MNNLHQQIKEALEKATPGPWNSIGDAVRKDYSANGWVCQMFQTFYGQSTTFENDENNAHLIANAPTWLRQLLDENERLSESEHSKAYWAREGLIKHLQDELEKVQNELLESERDNDELRDERDDLHAKLMCAESESHRFRTDHATMKEALTKISETLYGDVIDRMNEMIKIANNALSTLSKEEQPIEELGGKLYERTVR